jgi:alcohol dehydrogenase (cytochrome c)
MERLRVRSFLASAAAVILAGTATAQRMDKVPTADWPTYGGSFGHQRFSLLQQVTSENVTKLRVAWTFAVPDAGVVDNSLQTTPIVVRGRNAGIPDLDAVMLVTSPLGRVIALDASRGQPLWDFAPPLRSPLVLCCSRSNRGAAFGKVRRPDGAAEPRVYVATLDARLWALSASTGQPVAGFGDGAGPAGSVTVADNHAGYSLTMAPLFIPRSAMPPVPGAVARDLVVVGIAGGEYETRGFVTAYDALTGEMAWRFFTVPSPSEFGGDTWPNPDGGLFAHPFARGGGAVWMTPAYDAASGRLYFSVGNPAPNMDGTHRAGDNLFTDSVVALDVRTGQHVWHFQQVHHDLWDFDPASPPLLFEAAGRPAVGQAGKTGFFYILDRETGAPIFPCPETAVPASDVVAPDGSPEETAPTQPVCGPGLQFIPLLRPGESPLVDVKKAATPIFTPPSTRGTRIEPAMYGGSEWSPVASHPDLGLTFISGVIHGAAFVVMPEMRPTPGSFSFGGLPIPDFVNVAGTFTAIDVNAGRIRWQHHTQRPLVGGALATAGGLVFYGEGSPSGGALIALDASTGAQLFRHQTRGGVNAAPMTFLADGKQLVTVAAGGHLHYMSNLDNLIVTLGLPVTSAVRPRR